MCVSLLCCCILCCLLFLGFPYFCNVFPSVLWYCWLGLVTCKTVSHITYTVLARTNPAHSVSGLNWFLPILLVPHTSSALNHSSWHDGPHILNQSMPRDRRPGVVRAFRSVSVCARPVCGPLLFYQLWQQRCIQLVFFNHWCLANTCYCVCR